MKRRLLKRMVHSLPFVGPLLTEAAGPGEDAGCTPGGDESEFMPYGQRISWYRYLDMLLMTAASWGLCRLFRWSPVGPGS